ncbi:MAG: 30S ribosomal protein S4 [Thermoanaerobaculia bacterium]|nr:30S ribosomal protein S4 [Thermoanaerobaculia bacterium]
MNYTGPKVRLSRALGVALTPKAAKIMETKGYPPGQHGPDVRRRRRVSGYKAQLLEKQRLRFQYNVHERQMRTYYKRAARAKGNTGDVLVGLLETRLDAVILRAGLARTIYAARQYVSHGHVVVDGERVDRPGFTVKPGNVVAIRKRSQKILCFREALDTSPNAPDYLTVDKDAMTVRLERRPVREEVPVICDVARVIEFYSR